MQNVIYYPRSKLVGNLGFNVQSNFHDYFLINILWI